MSNWDKEAENFVTMGMEVILEVIKKFACMAGRLILHTVRHGNKKMFKFRDLGIVGLMALPVLLDYRFLVLPLMYLPGLMFWQSLKGGRFTKYFKKIQFHNRKGVYPYCIGVRELERENRIKYVFATDMPLSKWEARIKDIENAFDTRITSLKKLKRNTIEMCSLLEVDPRFQDIENSLRKIRFCSKMGIFPICIEEEQNEDAKTTVYKFESSIPLKDWKSSKTAIEHELSLKIFHIESLDNRITALHTTKERLPDMIGLTQKYLEAMENGIFRIGVSYLKEIVIDLDDIPHYVISGETGAGKSNMLRNIMIQALLQGITVKCSDFKGTEFEDFRGHIEVITQKKAFANMLDDAIEEHYRRIELFCKVKAVFDNLKVVQKNQQF